MKKPSVCRQVQGSDISMHIHKRDCNHVHVHVDGPGNGNIEKDEKEPNWAPGQELCKPKHATMGDVYLVFCKLGNRQQNSLNNHSSVLVYFL